MEDPYFSERQAAQNYPLETETRRTHLGHLKKLPYIIPLIETIILSDADADDDDDSDGNTNTSGPSPIANTPPPPPSNTNTSRGNRNR